MEEVQHGVFVHPYFVELQSQGRLSFLRTWKYVKVKHSVDQDVINLLRTRIKLRDELSNIPSNILRCRVVRSLNIAFRDDVRVVRTCVIK